MNQQEKFQEAFTDISKNEIQEVIQDLEKSKFLKNKRNNINLEFLEELTPENITEPVKVDEDPIFNISDILRKLKFKIIKVSSQKTNKYILYKEDPIFISKIINQTTKTDLVEDLVHHFTNYTSSWYNYILRDTKNPTVNKGQQAIENFLKIKVPRIDDVTNDPSKDLIFTEKGRTYFNFFQSTYYLNENVKKNLKVKDWSLIQKVILNLCEHFNKTENDVENKKESKKYYDWVINWLSCLYNKPTYRFSTAIIFGGVQGAGKQMFTKICFKIFDDCSNFANSKILASKYKAQLIEGKFLLLANEVKDQNNKYTFSNDLKELITDEIVPVERKFCDPYNAKNFVKTIFYSNERQPLAMEKDDRRYLFVFTTTKISSVLTSDELNKFWSDDQFFTDQVEGFLKHLLDYKYNLKLVTSEPIMTKAKQNVIESNFTNFKSGVLQILEDLYSSWVYFAKDTCYYIPLQNVLDSYNENVHLHLIKGTKYMNNKFGQRLADEDIKTYRKTLHTYNTTWIKIPEDIVQKNKNDRELKDKALKEANK